MLRHLSKSGILEERARSAQGERGVILLVVLGLLQLLTVLGITFVLYASHGGPVDAIARVDEQIQRAQTALTALLENPDDADLHESAVVSVEQALRESCAIIGASETPTPDTRHLDGLLQAANALFDQLVALLREPRCITCP